MKKRWTDRGEGAGATVRIQERARRGLCVTALAVTIPIGLLWRLAPLHLAPFAYKYGGSALWAVAVYWAVAAMLARRSPALVAPVAATVAVLVEWLKRLYWPPLDHFRETLAGKLLLGRYFSYGAIAAYWIAIGAVATLDSWLEKRRREPPG